jgi:hypothetical protein
VRSKNDGDTSSRTDQRESNGVLTLTIKVCIRDQDVIENFVCDFILSALREKKCILQHSESLFAS